MYTNFLYAKIQCFSSDNMYTVKLTKNKKTMILVIPEAVLKLYSLEEGQIFNLVVKEREPEQKLLLLTYATPIQ